MARTIIYINGASSSGKSTLANWIQTNYESPLFYYSIDTLLETMPADELTRLRESSKTKAIDWEAVFLAYFRSAEAIFDSGLDVILDCPLYSSRIQFFNDTIAKLDPVVILLTCPLDVLAEREKARGDRWIGLAAYQAPRVMASIDYTFLFDSSKVSAEHMGREILTHCANPSRH